jgi:hypothetical protein
MTRCVSAQRQRRTRGRPKVYLHWQPNYKRLAPGRQADARRRSVAAADAGQMLAELTATAKHPLLSGESVARYEDIQSACKRSPLGRGSQWCVVSFDGAYARAVARSDWPTRHFVQDRAGSRLPVHRPQVGLTPKRPSPSGHHRKRFIFEAKPGRQDRVRACRNRWHSTWLAIPPFRCSLKLEE